MKKRKNTPFGSGEFIAIYFENEVFVAFMLLTTLQLQAKVVAQRLSIRVSDATFREVAREIESQTGFTFLFNDMNVNQLKRITLDVENVALDVVLKHCLDGSGLSYRKVENTLVIVPAETRAFPQVRNGLPPDM